MTEYKSYFYNNIIMDSDGLINLLEHFLTRLTNIELKLDQNESDNKNILNILRTNEIIKASNRAEGDFGDDLVFLRDMMIYYYSIGELDYFYNFGFLLNGNDYYLRNDHDPDVFRYNCYLIMAEIWKRSYKSNWKEIDKLICKGYFDGGNQKDEKFLLKTSYSMWCTDIVIKPKILENFEYDFPTKREINLMKEYFDMKN